MTILLMPEVYRCTVCACETQPCRRTTCTLAQGVAAVQNCAPGSRLLLQQVGFFSGWTMRMAIHSTLHQPQMETATAFEVKALDPEIRKSQNIKIQRDA